MKTPTSRRVRFFFLWIFPLLFVVTVGMVLFFSMKGMRLARESVSWPAVDGVIRHSSVEQVYGDDGVGYHAKVLYDFTVDGETLSGDVVGYGFGLYASGRQSDAESVVALYPVGKNVAVYYKPDDPRICALEPGFALSAGTVWMPVFILFITWCIITGWVIVLMPRRAKR